MFIVGEETGCSIAELQNLDLCGVLKIKKLENVRSNVGSAKDANLKGKRHIQSLKLIWNDCDDVTIRENADCIAAGLQPNSKLKKLAIENYTGSKLPNLINSYLANLVELSLFRCHRCVQLPSLEKLPSPQTLAINEMNATMYFCNDSGQKGRFVLPYLKKLKVDDTPGLINLPDLPSIESLEPEFCKEEILTSATEITPPLKNFVISGFVKLTSFPQGLLRNKTHLLSLEISNCHKLESFSHELKSLSSLQSLCITNCPEIKSLSELEGLKSLKSLGIDRCDSLLSLPEGLKALKSLKHLSLSNCENITALPAAMQHLTGLHTLHIWSCPSLVTLPGWLGKLVELREMELWYCENLQCLPESMKRLTALQFL
ncbi:LOW QUALITY PROTEIN: LRR domain containing protein [Trema orientale]|uniref:LRR domain containing protein n=1 Tax=Trema orientale TaxID=63057 RepID=A0A2P5EGX9_TREOI|nr:LOW QUALITY PROTEIN: LRR domain containing protein [Trema orientale]